MREYEVTIIVKPDLDDQAREELIQRVSAWLTPEGDESAEPTVNHWGRRSLAYPIRDYQDGYYVFYETTMEPARLHQVERDILYIEDVLRHLVVRKED